MFSISRILLNHIAPTNFHANLLFKTIQLVHSEDWAKNNEHQRAIETNLGILRNCQLRDDKDSLHTEQKLFERTETLYRRLQTLIQEQKTGGVSYKETPLKFYKLEKTDETVSRLTHLSNAYRLMATEKQIITETKVVTISSDKKQLAQDSVECWSTITSSLSYPDISVYIASDRDEVIQGIALTNINEYKGTKRLYLNRLATSPANTPVLGNEKNIVKWVGSGLIGRIIHDILLDPELEKIVRLRASDSARDFYKKLGFTYEDNYNDFELNEENLIKLSNRFNQLKL